MDFMACTERRVSREPRFKERVKLQNNSTSALKRKLDEEMMP